MCERICKLCGGDDEIAKIGEALGFRPDIAFMRIRKLEQFILNGVENGYITIPDKDDPAMDTIFEILDKNRF